MTPVEKIAELIRTGNLDELVSVFEKDPVSVLQRTQGISLLQLAAYCRNHEAVEKIRFFKPELEASQAAILGDMRQLKALLDQGSANVTDFSADGFTLLGLAAYFGQREIINYLLDAGADPNVQSANGFCVTPLHSACAISDFVIAATLIKKGADVNARQSQNVTPLHSAAHNGQTELAELLLSNGAEVNASTNAGQTPLQMAIEKGHEKTAELILRHGGH